MPPLPATSLRSNLGTWVVPPRHGPAVAAAMLATPSLVFERYDPQFRGQDLTTTYFDTDHFDLRKARVRGKKYLTLRLRCYAKADGGALYALSAKTEDQKFRAEIQPDHAELILAGQGQAMLLSHLPPDMQARLMELAGDSPLCPAVAVCCRRYAVEDDTDRLTLDCDIHTDAGKCLPFGVLEFKSAGKDTPPPGPLLALRLRPLKISKFLWATGVV